MKQMFNALVELFKTICSRWPGMMIVAAFMLIAIAYTIAVLCRAADIDVLVAPAATGLVYIPVYIKFAEICRDWQFERIVREVDEDRAEELRDELDQRQQ